jgi:hypothetical protein
VVLTPKYSKKHDLEDSLAKYDENLEVDEYSNGKVDDCDKVRFLEYYFEQDGIEFVDVKEAVYNELLKEGKVLPFNDGIDGDKDTYLYRAMYNNREKFTEAFIKANSELCKTFGELYEKHGEDWNGGSYRINPETEEWEDYSTYNPESMYDWYEIGGRWDKSIKKKDGKFVNECLLGEIDWTDYSPDDYEEEEQENIWGEKYKPLKDGVKWHFTEGNMPYCLFIDGENHSQGKMGWWGMSDDKYTSEEWNKIALEHLKELPEDSTVVCVDFHI